jgi:DHA3 family macrolide efflux protein-like MFS transporter
VLSWVGSQVAMFALIWWLTDKTGSATVLATATMVSMLPQIVLGPIAGVYVDRWNRRITMIVADGSIALVSLALAYLFWSGQAEIWHIYVVMMARALGGMFHWPAMQSSTALMVPKKHLARVSGLNQAMGGALNIVGPALGALVLEYAEIQHALMIDVTTAVLAITPLLFIVIPQPARQDRDQADAKPSMWTELREGAQYMFQWRGLVLLTAMAMVFKIALTPAFSLLPLMVRDHFDGGAPELATLQSAFGIGIILGGTLLGVWGGFKRRILTTMMGISVVGVALVGLGLLPPGWFDAAIPLMFVGGFSAALCDGPLFAVLQGTIAPEMQGRVFMLFGSLVSLTSPFGLAVAGPVTDAVGIQIWYVVAGILCAGMGIWGFFLPAIVHIEEFRAAQLAPELAAEDAIPVQA